MCPAGRPANREFRPVLPQKPRSTYPPGLSGRHFLSSPQDPTARVLNASTECAFTDRHFACRIGLRKLAWQDWPNRQPCNSEWPPVTSLTLSRTGTERVRRRSQEGSMRRSLSLVGRLVMVVAVLTASAVSGRGHHPPRDRRVDEGGTERRSPAGPHRGRSARLLDRFRDVEVPAGRRRQPPRDRRHREERPHAGGRAGRSRTRRHGTGR